MKLNYLLKLALLFILPIVSSAQTTLAVGDIAVFLNQADSPDDFAFVTFVDISEGTGIFFTDCGANAAGLINPCPEGAVKYTVPTGGLSAGDIIIYSTNTSDFLIYKDTRVTGTYGLSLATGGDQIIVFQDSSNAAGGTNAGNTSTFLFINQNASTAFTGNPNDPNQSGLPPGLNDTTSPRSALGLGIGTGPQDEWDNTVYTGTYDFSSYATRAESIAAAKLAMTDPANYTGASYTLDPTYSNAYSAIPTKLNLNVLSTSKFLSNSFAVYPNPSNGNITIRNSGVALQNISITDLNGRTVFTNKMNHITTNVDLNLKLTSGIYLMKLTSKDASTIKKIVIK